MSRPCETCEHFMPRLRHQGFDWCGKFNLVTGVARFSPNHCGDEGRDWKRKREATFDEG